MFFHKRSRPQRYTGALVLGLNDALVEMLGALTGLTVALHDATVIASASLITGIAASLSMAASEFLAVSEDKNANPFVAAAVTGGAYFIAVLFLVTPYLVYTAPWMAWRVAVGAAVVIIALFNLYASRLDASPFLPRFVRMVLISLSVAAVSYGIGLLVSSYVG